MIYQEEDYRAVNAREGKALFIPGKTDEQMKSEYEQREAKANTPLTVELTMTNREADRLCDALDEVLYTYKRAATLFDFMYEALASGYFGADHPGILALCEVSGKAFSAAAEGDGDFVERMNRDFKLEVIAKQREQEQAA
ncbi:hypothetical protein [Tropicibacter naphthalenivorans]|uniref:Uncharacterized protein n=1 Tax=Tropicibacter naphthalenivorans TaxID=441103 RepID=A0A0P1GHA0_9RHOB|nr:hypothetical protein [Tropicibacter naphthalenivorans]CUH80723.1 hypothetical protein TRN7648_03114 [Tropicibacter naphthalenivorans]SMC89607.1 hypothetical protein SAMN04488093_10684 [Tropicibacter naphthalenivorans]